MILDPNLLYVPFYFLVDFMWVASFDFFYHI